jgi:hypothetical protein
MFTKNVFLNSLSDQNFIDAIDAAKQLCYVENYYEYSHKKLDRKSDCLNGYTIKKDLHTMI